MINLASASLRLGLRHRDQWSRNLWIQWRAKIRGVEAVIGHWFSREHSGTPSMVMGETAVSIIHGQRNAAWNGALVWRCPELPFVLYKYVPLLHGQRMNEIDIALIKLRQVQQSEIRNFPNVILPLHCFTHSSSMTRFAASCYSPSHA